MIAAISQESNCLSMVAWHKSERFSLPVALVADFEKENFLVPMVCVDALRSRPVSCVGARQWPSFM